MSAYSNVADLARVPSQPGAGDDDEPHAYDQVPDSPADDDEMPDSPAGFSGPFPALLRRKSVESPATFAQDDLVLEHFHPPREPQGIVRNLSRHADPILSEIGQLLKTAEERTAFFRAAHSSADQAEWCGYAEQQDDNRVIQLLSLVSFRRRLNTHVVHDREVDCLQWLSNLYLNPSPDDKSQPLPYRFDADEPRVQRIRYFWGHFQCILSTLDLLGPFYHAGYIHLLSREQSAMLITNPGNYLFRLSNRRPSTVILTNYHQHIYLDKKHLKKLNLLMPNDVKAEKHTFVGKRFSIHTWSISSVKKFMKWHKVDLDLRHPVLGAIPIEDLDNHYEDHVRQSYHEYALEESKYWSIDSDGAALGLDAAGNPYNIFVENAADGYAVVDEDSARGREGGDDDDVDAVDMILGHNGNVGEAGEAGEADAAPDAGEVYHAVDDLQE